MRLYLCALPDNVLNCDCCGQGLLEVKCPLSNAGKHSSDANLPQAQCALAGCRAGCPGVIFSETASAPGCPGPDENSSSCNAFSPSRPCVRPVQSGHPCIRARQMSKGPIKIWRAFADMHLHSVSFVVKWELLVFHFLSFWRVDWKRRHPVSTWK